MNSKPKLYLPSALALALAAVTTQAADRSWSGGTGSYNNPANWTGGLVPGAADNAINDSGTNNQVQINVGDPDWAVSQLRAGYSSGNGAFQQNGQTVTLGGSPKALRLGVVVGRQGVYTLNGGTLNYTNGEVNVGQLGQGLMNINGGAVTGSGTFAVNVGTSLDGVSATMDGSTNKDGYTWFEQGLYTADTTRGVPAAGTTVTSESQPDHSFTMPASYAGNSVVMIDTNLSSATLTFSAPQALSGLSFLGSAGHGPVTINYIVHHADSSTETGSLAIKDWFANDGNVVVRTGGRVLANGLGFQIINDGPNKPYLLSTDLTLTNTTSPVTSVNLAYVSGGVACLFGVSGSSGAGFSPLALSGYNADLVLENNAPIYVANTVTDTLTQTAGSINITGEFWIGNYGVGVFNFSGGTNTLQNWTALGRSGGNGTLNMSGGEIDKVGNGNFLIGTGYQAPNGSTPTGVLNQSGGVINDAGEFQVPENAPAVGTYNISGNAVLNANNWMSIGRAGGNGTFSMTGGTINKANNGNFIIGDGNNSVATATHSAGTINCASEFWIGQGGGSGTYNLSGTGAINVDNWLAIGRAGGNGTLTMTGGTLTKNGNGGNHITIGSGGTGTLTQNGGAVVSTLSDSWVGENSTGEWDLNGGTAQLSLLRVGLNSGSSGLLNLNGGTLTVGEIAGGAGYSMLTLNGVTIVASGNNPTFFHDLGQAFVAAGGATFDTAGYDVTVAQSFANSGSGGIVKKGAGTLTFTGANDLGPVSVHAGQVVTTTATAVSADYTAADGAGFGVKVLSANAQLPIGNLTLGSSAGATLSADLDGFGNPTAAPLNVTGTLAVNGTITVNLTDALPQVGQFPLIAYGSRTGAGSFVLGSMPVGVVASLVTNTSSIDIKITSINVPRWEGLAGGNWDIGVTTNWVNFGTGLPTYYSEGSDVIFNDNAQGTTSINLTTTVHPGSVTVNNTNLVYTVSGTGKISGSTGLSKQGPGTLTVTTANDYTGRTTVSGGVLSVNKLANGGSPSSIGASTASPSNLVLANGTLAYTGPAVKIDRGYSVQDTNSAIDAESDLTLGGTIAVAPVGGFGFTKTGPALLAYTGGGSNGLSAANSPGYLVQAGTVAFDGSAAPQTNYIQGSHLGVNGLSANAQVTVTNSTLNLGGNLDLGNQPNTFGTLVLNNGANLNVGSWMTLGDGANSVATFSLNGGTLNVPNGRLFLCSAPGTTATFNMNGGTLNKSGDYFAVVNGGWNGAGARTGVVNQVNGTINSASELWIGDGGGAGNGSLGVYNLSGGSLTVNNWFGIGRDGSTGIFHMTGGTLSKGVNGDMVIGRGGSSGTFIMSGGTLTKDNVNPLIVGQGQGIGEFDLSGGTVTTTGEYWLGVDTGTVATNNISGTAQMTVHNWVTIGRNGLGVVNMSSGQFNADRQPFIVGIWGGSQGYWNQSGGSLYVNQDIWIGQGDNNAHGVINLSGGTITNTGWLAIGREGAHGVLNISGGTMVKAGTGNNISIAHNGGGSGDVILSGTGTFLCLAGETWVGENGAPGTWTMNGGTAILGTVHLAQNADATGVLTLNGGSLTATEIATGNTGATQRELDFNGGTLVAGMDNANFIHDLSAAKVQAGGAVINSAGHTVSINQALVDAGGGGLTKNGNGTLYLNGANTYTGPTLVNAGALGGNGVIVSPVTVASGAALAPGAGLGTLTVNNALTFTSGSKAIVEVSNDGGLHGDLVTGLTSVNYAGTLEVHLLGSTAIAPGSVVKLFNSATAGTGNFAQVRLLPCGSGTFNPATGELTITSVTAPVVSKAQLVNGNLVTSITGGTPGSSYTWLSSTNVAAPLSSWVTNSAGLFDNTGAATSSIPVSPAQPQQYLKLRVP